MKDSMSKGVRPLRTAQEAREDLVRRGKGFAEWARENGFDASAVRQMLSGRGKGLRGEAHRIAVRLGMKDGIEEER